MKKRILSYFLMSALTMGIFSGCGSKSPAVGSIDAAMELVNNSTSVETSIAFDLTARTGSFAGSSGHTGALTSYITINSLSSPLAYHTTTFSRVFVDTVESTEEKEIYVIPSDKDNEYLKYEYIPESDKWQLYNLSREEILSLPTKTGINIDWEEFALNAVREDEIVELNKIPCYVYTGEINKYTLQHFFGEDILNSFMYNVEQLLTDTIPFKLYIHGETGYPVQFSFDVSKSFTVSDMVFEKALITVGFDKWNALSEIEVPKKVTVVATNPVKEHYNSFYAWNLFLPFVNGISSSSGSSGSLTGTFQAAWNTFQFRLDDFFSTLPLEYKDIAKLGYKVEDSFKDTIIDPNSVIENVGLIKGNDKIICALYNDTTSPQPITACKVGSLDLSVSANTTNSITLFLPGEIHLGVTRDSIYAAYGEPDSVSTSFAADLCTWKGEDDQHCLIAEISPVNQQVIRLRLKNIPVVGTK